MEAYQKNFLDFICGSPTSTKVLGHDEEIEARPNKITQEEEVQTQEPKDLINGAKQKIDIKPLLPI